MVLNLRSLFIDVDRIPEKRSTRGDAENGLEGLGFELVCLLP